MRRNLALLFFVSCITSSSIYAQSSDPVKNAKQSNEVKSDKGMVDKNTAQFLVESADARMMDKMEGTLAVKKGTTTAVREYGKLMVKDQSFLLAKINALAKAKKITLPTGISNKKEDGRDDLSEKTGKDFDKKFLSMMRIDHKRDVKMFEEATHSTDQAISSFAMKYLPMIQSHLDKVNALEKELDL